MDATRLPLFIETPNFSARWERLGLTDKDCSALQAMIRMNPTAGVVIPDTGGYRKLRFAPDGRGKSGGFRIAYLNYPRFRTVIRVIVFAKNEVANISAAGKKSLAQQAVVYETLLGNYFGRGST